MKTPKQEVVCYCKEKDLPGIIRDPETLRTLGNEAYYLSKLEEALDYFKKALEIDERFKNFKGMATDLNSIGSIYWIWGNHEKMLQYHEKALRIAHEIGDRRKAIGYYETALRIAQETGDKRNEGKWFGNLGNACSDLGDTRKTIEYYEKALWIAQETGDRRTEGTLLNNLGDTFRDENKYKEALACYLLAKEIHTRIGP